MVSLSFSSAKSSKSNLSSASQTSLNHVPQSPLSSSSSLASSSKLSLDQADEENITITAGPPLSKKMEGKQKSQDDNELRTLAISTNMTEMSYSISDIQTRIFEIQELRHKSQSSGDTAGTTSVIDQSLMSLDERLEALAQGMKAINESVEPLTHLTPTADQDGENSELAALLRKHAALVAEWEAVQDESEVLREELKEDKWLTVFRTVTDQADGMMSSLEKAVNRCQEFIWQVHKFGVDDPLSRSTVSLDASVRSDKAPVINMDVFTQLQESFEAKKKHYMPATSKVLSIIDKGVRDRVTKNGETLRRHAESAQRWKNLRERIQRTDSEMESVRKILTGEGTESEGGSSASGASRNGYLGTPPSRNKAPISRSISPLRKFAKKITGSQRSPNTPVTPLNIKSTRVPSSEPMSKRKSLFNALRPSQPTTPVTPDRPGHKHTQSLTPESSPNRHARDLSARDITTVKARQTPQKEKGPAKIPWNSSTKVETPSSTIKQSPARRTPSAAGYYADIPIPPIPPIGPGTPYRRSLSRTSMASSRPWSPLTSSTTTQSSNPQSPGKSHVFRPPSRAKTPSQTPSRITTQTPRPRPKTPSQIPKPAANRSPGGTSDWGDDDYVSLKNRSYSPAFSMSATSGVSAGGLSSYPPRPPSRSMIPIPSVQLSTPSRPGSAMSRPGTSMSAYGDSPSGGSTFRTSAMRAQTPENLLRSRAQQVPVYQGSVRAGRPSLGNLPPSSFRRDASTARAPSRPGSRQGANTPGADQLPMHEYVPTSTKDPLDLEVANIVNSIAHGLLVERVDPPLKKAPKEGEEIKAQYAFSNALGRKVVTCRLTTLVRPGKVSGPTTTKKVMVRVGGGWQDLNLYMLNRQAGM
ncbi:uncharacterized protein SCHCODRAFT_02619391 [Schizophyllum commune H4-8]|uniref:uncharacterized protein n=1 Tax=Schizophyllum commune (strain H4-8 / FGSC 9210) TaxID=578458 RepID=UPI00215F090C|nr:uncharacterized protein SCHCODRAFT_02619391 [Schizophyllum commune H4-8]KAI5895430.1 hypothetical protein SCHCODRAFT_02619391 [Schizophyllum commune H4-8]